MFPNYVLFIKCYPPYLTSITHIFNKIYHQYLLPIKIEYLFFFIYLIQALFL